MPVIDCLRTVAVERTARVMQLEGMFDIAPTQKSEHRFKVNVPIEGFDWNIGLIVGASGSGKTTVAREAFSRNLISGFEWPEHKSLIDGFPSSMGIKDITGLLSSVGFSSPPSWLRPFRCLSNGEQFRVTLARAMAESPDLAVVDEFTSVVDRTVAQIGSAAIAKSVRRTGRKLIAVSCHFDIVEWLDPDWVLEMPNGEFTRRSLRRRPKIELEIIRCDRATWEHFKRYHYLDTNMNPTAKCFAAYVMGKLAAFTAVTHFPHPRRSGWREHRTVCLPDFQGVGIGNTMSEYIASMYAATGKPYRSVTGNPAMIGHRARSPAWKMIRDVSLIKRNAGPLQAQLNKTLSSKRFTASFEYVGFARAADARRFGIV